MPVNFKLSGKASLPDHAIDSSELTELKNVKTDIWVSFSKSIPSPVSYKIIASNC